MRLNEDAETKESESVKVVYVYHRAAHTNHSSFHTIERIGETIISHCPASFFCALASNTITPTLT